ncbi:MAG: CAP domain-containing protein [Cyanobacteria bacterium P01_A01_bin.135]
MARLSLLLPRRPVLLGSALVLAIAAGACSQPVGQSSDAPVAESGTTEALSDTPSAAAIEAGSEFAQIEQTIFEQVNAYRDEQGLPPLEISDTIRQQATAHSQAMAQGEVPVSHEGFDGRVEAIAKSVDYRSAAENVAYNEGYSSPGEQAVQGWLESPGHLENIRGDYDLTGVGVAQSGQAYYFTQIFIEAP